MIKMIRISILCFSLTASAWTAHGYGVSPEEAQERMSRASQNELAGHFRHCFQRLLNQGLSRPDAGAICGAQARNRLPQNQAERQASWQFLICLEEQSSANGSLFSEVVGLCRTLLSSAPQAPAVSHSGTSQI